VDYNDYREIVPGSNDTTTGLQTTVIVNQTSTLIITVTATAHTDQSAILWLGVRLDYVNVAPGVVHFVSDQEGHSSYSYTFIVQNVIPGAYSINTVWSSSNGNGYILKGTLVVNVYPVL
jgi:hypothetical protein